MCHYNFGDNTTQHSKEQNNVVRHDIIRLLKKNKKASAYTEISGAQQQLIHDDIQIDTILKRTFLTGCGKATLECPDLGNVGPLGIQQSGNGKH